MLPLRSPALAPPSRPRSGPRALGSETGLTLIEVLVTALIVILLGSATATALISTSHASGDQRFRSQADALANQDQERLRGLSDEQLNGLHQSRTQTVDGHDFTVTSVSSFLDTAGGSSCTSQAAASYKITSTASWTEGFNSRTAADTSVTEESLLARPVTGNLLTQVNDQTQQPLSGVTVAANGPSTQTGASDNNGCVLFAGLTPGAYTVNVTDPGYVDPDGNASPPNNTANVTTSGVAKPAGNPFEMGLAGSIAATFTTSTAGAGGQADGISWLGSGALDAMSGFQSATAAAPPPAPPTPLTTGPLFPFDVAKSGAAVYTKNYRVWGGRCAQQQPLTGGQYNVIPGSVGQAQSVSEPLLAVNSVTFAGMAVKPDNVKLSFTSKTGAACTDSWYPTLSTAATPDAMPATGWLAYPGQPYADSKAGALLVCADSGGYMNSVTAINKSFSAPNPVTIAITPASIRGTC